MEATPAIVLTHVQLKELMMAAGEEAANRVVTDLRNDLIQDPRTQTLNRLRAYVADPTTIPDPRDQWADSQIIRQIQPTVQGKTKSISWFMKFQKQTNLKNCITRKSQSHGRAREWCFEDIRNAWSIYYAFK